MGNNILIITGEPSGDMRGGELLKELKKLAPETSFWGIGGDHMEDEGMELIENVRDLSIIGVWEIFSKLPKIHAQYRNVIQNTLKRKPALAILIDYPGFNLKLAKFLHSQNIPVIYYIIPQVWAWGSWRIKTLKRYVTKALVLFKFEKDLLTQEGVPAEFVGHPLIDKAPALLPRNKEDAFTIALLPGSRNSEIRGIFPLMLDAAEKLHKERPDIGFILAENSNVDEALYDAALAAHKSLNVLRRKDDTFGVLNKCDFALIASGTATLEATLLEKPMVITYRAAFMTELLAHIFAHISFLGLANIIAGREIVPELIKQNATSQKLLHETLKIISDESRMQNMRSELRKVRQSLGEKGASMKAALEVRKILEEKSSP